MSFNFLIRKSVTYPHEVVGVIIWFVGSAAGSCSCFGSQECDCGYFVCAKVSENLEYAASLYNRFVGKSEPRISY